MFSRALQVVGRPTSVETPRPDGPRHCGQFAAMGAPASTTAMAARAMRIVGDRILPPSLTVPRRHEYRRDRDMSGLDDSNEQPDGGGADLESQETVASGAAADAVCGPAEEFPSGSHRSVHDPRADRAGRDGDRLRGRAGTAVAARRAQDAPARHGARRGAAPLRARSTRSSAGCSTRASRGSTRRASRTTEYGPQPYFAMELVRGQPPRRVHPHEGARPCATASTLVARDRRRRTARAPARDHPPRSQAGQHPRDRHRRSPKILDFGIARGRARRHAVDGADRRRRGAGHGQST